MCASLNAQWNDAIIILLIQTLEHSFSAAIAFLYSHFSCCCAFCRRNFAYDLIEFMIKNMEERIDLAKVNEKLGKLLPTSKITISIRHFK